jgi:hypothetical protein
MHNRLAIFRIFDTMKEVGTVDAEQACKHECELLGQQAVSGNSYGEAYQRKVRREKCDPVIPGCLCVRREEEGAYNAGQGTYPFKYK